MIEFRSAGGIEEGTEDALLVAVGADDAYDDGAAWVIEVRSLFLPWA